MPFYAVAAGRRIGVFDTWGECKASVDGFPHARFKKFADLADANRFAGRDPPPRDPPPRDPPPRDPPPREVDYYVYTDGACSNNGARMAKCGIGVFFGHGDERNVSRRVYGKQTNNVAELMAVIEAGMIIRPDVENGKRVVIVSDSEYVLRCVTTYGERCKRSGWTTPMPNKALVKEAYAMFENNAVEFLHVKAHTGRHDIHSIGNQWADKLAVASIK